MCEGGREGRREEGRDDSLLAEIEQRLRGDRDRFYCTVSGCSTPACKDTLTMCCRCTTYKRDGSIGKFSVRVVEF